MKSLYLTGLNHNSHDIQQRHRIDNAINQNIELEKLYIQYRHESKLMGVCMRQCDKYRKYMIRTRKTKKNKERKVSYHNKYNVNRKNIYKNIYNNISNN